MTTICFDGRFIAADTLCVYGDGTINQAPQHKLVVRDGHVFSATGHITETLRDRIADWWLDAQVNGRMQKMPHCGTDDLLNDGNFIIFKIGRGKIGSLSYVCQDWTEHGHPCGWGSGADLAVGYMEAGNNAMEAVMCAMKHDSRTGGDVEYVDTYDLDKGVQVFTTRTTAPMLHGGASFVADGLRACDATLNYLRRDGDGADVWRLDVSTLLSELGLGDLDVAPYSMLYVPPATAERPLEGKIHEFTEVRTGPWFTREETEARLRYELRGLLRWPVRETLKATVHWRIRPEVSACYDPERMVTEWRGYARLVVLPAAELQREFVDIHKPRAPAKGASGGNLWADACTGRLVLGTGCGECLRCNREWHALVRQIGVERTHGGDSVTITQADVKRALDLAPLGLTRQPEEFEPPKSSVISREQAREVGHRAVAEHDALIAHVDAWNTASAESNHATMKRLDDELRALQFPPNVELVIDNKGFHPRKVIKHAEAQPTA